MIKRLAKVVLFIPAYLITVMQALFYGLIWIFTGEFKLKDEDCVLLKLIDL